MTKGSNRCLALVGFQAYFVDSFAELFILNKLLFCPGNNATDRTIFLDPKFLADLFQPQAASFSGKINRHVARLVHSAPFCLFQFLLLELVTLANSLFNFEYCRSKPLGLWDFSDPIFPAALQEKADNHPLPGKYRPDVGPGSSHDTRRWERLCVVVLT